MFRNVSTNHNVSGGCCSAYPILVIANFNMVVLDFNTYPTFPPGFQGNLPLDSVHPHCILGSHGTIESNGQVYDMSLK